VANPASDFVRSRAVTKERFQIIEEKTKRLRTNLELRRPEVQDFVERFEMSWVYHDSALEGTVYTPQELAAALHPGAVAAEASLLPIVWEIRNHKAALEYVRDEAKVSKKHSALTMTFVKRVHELVSGNTQEAQAARALAERRERTEKELAKEREKQGFRKDMPLHRTYFHEIHQPSKIQAALEKLIDWTASAEFRELHPIMQAARVQHGFIQIFPFTENSGKVGRFLTNYILLRNQLWPVVVVSVDRQKYYESFRGSVSGFANLMMDSLENSLENGLKYFRDLSRAYR
jgi:Fic family protein